MTKAFTYGLLFEKLQGLGYIKKRVEMNGGHQLIFQHPQFERATIFLPDAPVNEPVASMHLLGVRATLKNHGVVQADPEEEFLQTLQEPLKNR